MLSGMENLAVVVVTGTASGARATLEVAGEDEGADRAAWTDNYALGTLQLGDGDVGRVLLQDGFDNHTNKGEALYVKTLVLNPGATIGGARLYYLNPTEGDNDPPPKRFFVADANLDGQVGLADLAALADNYGIATGAFWRQGDFTGDQAVGLADLLALADNYGSTTQVIRGAAPAGAPAMGTGTGFPPADLVQLEYTSLGSPAGYPALTRYKVRLVVKDGYHESHKVVAQGFQGRFDGDMNQVWLDGGWMGIQTTPTLEYAQYLTAAQKQRDSHILAGDEDHPIMTQGAPNEDNDAPGPPGSLEGTGTWLAGSATTDMAVGFEDPNDWDNTVLGETLDVAHIVVPDDEEVTFTGSGGWKYWDDDDEMWVYGQNTVSLTVPEEE